MKLSQAEIAERMQTLHGWRLEQNAIEKLFTFKDFPEAVAFVNRLVPEAEAADHHPDIHINYKRVSLVYSNGPVKMRAVRAFGSAPFLTTR